MTAAAATSNSRIEEPTSVTCSDHAAATSRSPCKVWSRARSKASISPAPALILSISALPRPKRSGDRRRRPRRRTVEVRSSAPEARPVAWRPRRRLRTARPGPRRSEMQRPHRGERARKRHLCSRVWLEIGFFSGDQVAALPGLGVYEHSLQPLQPINDTHRVSHARSKFTGGALGLVGKPPRSRRRRPGPWQSRPRQRQAATVSRRRVLQGDGGGFGHLVGLMISARDTGFTVPPDQRRRRAGPVRIRRCGTPARWPRLLAGSRWPSALATTSTADATVDCIDERNGVSPLRISRSIAAG